ncbi:MAG: DUF3012 domain-containing protein [Gammaproteobacteria bacterium]|jgi:hypothetical protein
MTAKILTALFIGLLLSACAPVGSDAWCEKMGDKPKGDWTGDEAADYTKYCVLGMDPDKWCEKMEALPKNQWTVEDAEDYAKQCVSLGFGGN